MLLHLGVAIVAPGCVVAGWWQATRALAGNTLSWVYSVEWPVFALIAIAGWWQLIHEDPEVYEARKRRSPGGDGGAAVVAAPEPTSLGPGPEVTVEPTTARLAARLAVLVGFEFVLGIAALLAIPFSRPGGWLPAKGEAVYIMHAVFGLLVALGALALLVRVRGAARTSQIIGWLGFSGVALAGGGGLLTEAPSLSRLLGMALMFVGAMMAGFSYMIPTLLSSSHKVSPVSDA